LKARREVREFALGTGAAARGSLDHSHSPRGRSKSRNTRFQIDFPISRSRQARNHEVKEMRRTILLIALTLVCGCAVLAQTQDTRARATGSNDTSATASQANRSINIQSDTHVAGQLQDTLDSRKAKVGDQVVLKTTQAIKSDRHVVVDKGARLLGHVTSVEQTTSANGQSQIGLLFDRLESGSLRVSITATISSITQPATHSQASQDDMFGSDTNTMTSSRSTATTQRSGGSQGGGGLLGGLTNTAGGVVNTTTSAVGGVASSATSAVGSTVHSTTTVAGQTTAGVGRSLGGIQINESSSTSAQGGSTLSLQGGNLRLEKDITFNLVISQSASAGKNQ